MKFKIIITAAMLTLIMCGSAFATANFEARGSAVATGFLSTSSSTTYKEMTTMMVSNISGVDVDCKVTIYDSNGNDISSIIDVYKDNTSSTSAILVSSGSVPFTIPAGATRKVNTWKPNMNKQLFGHILIEWSTEDGNVRKALIAEGRLVSTNGSGPAYSSTLNINSGQPF